MAITSDSEKKTAVRFFFTNGDCLLFSFQVHKRETPISGGQTLKNSSNNSRLGFCILQVSWFVIKENIDRKKSLLSH